MQCRNCGAAIHEGDSFCRTCAMPINMSTNSVIEDISNPATNDFMVQNNNYTVPNQEQLFYNDQKSERITESKIGYKDTNDNKKHINKKDGNDRLSATIFNFITLAIMVIVAIVILYLIFTKVIKPMM